MSQADTSGGEDVQSETNDADQLTQDAARAEMLIRSLVTGNHVDSEVAKQLHGDLVTMFGQMVNDHEAINAGEIALAMWGELLRIEEMMTQAAAEAQKSETSTTESMDEALDNEELELLGQPSDDDTNGTTARPNDPAFH